MNLPEIIRNILDQHGLMPEGAQVVVGVSGGADSVALLRAFHRLEIPCTVAHMNHQLRGAESDGDERFVRTLADELNLPMVARSVDVQKLADESGLSIEMAARQARHDFFSTFENAVIALAHHADDQAETFILKLARGAGTEGLGGMPFFQTLENLRIIRPMLNIPRTKILQWLEENDFAWREDASNSDETFLRNRVRHTILPLLETELNPNIRETILRTMDILREEHAWMDSLVDGASSSVTHEQDARFSVTEPEAPSTLPLAARRRILRKWLFDQGATDVTFDAVETILKLMDRGEGTTIFELNGKQRVVVEYGTPRFEHVEQAFQPAQSWRLTIEKGTGWRKDHGKGAGVLPAEASFDAKKVGDSPIEIRGVLPGDRMNPFGMKGSRKLQDILTDQKVPRAQRPLIPVVTCRDEIIWIPGYRMARGWEVCGADGNAVHVRVAIAFSQW